MACSDSCPLLPEAIFRGGSGGASGDREMPDLLPERLEAGTLPVPAIISMGEGARFVKKLGVKTVSAWERELKKQLIRGILAMPSYVIYEPWFENGPLLINRKDMPSEEAAQLLAKKGLFIRGGFHCAPLAHRYLGTEESGALRLSPGLFNTPAEIERALNILESV